MEENHVLRSTEPPPPRKKPQKNIILAGLLLLLVLAISAGAYFLGRMTPQNVAVKKTESTENPFPTSSENLSTTQSANTGTGTTSPAAGTLTPSPTPIEKSRILSSVPTLDGFRSSNNGGNNTLDIRTGRNENLVTRGFVTFDITDIPNGVKITSATLRLYLSKIDGNPFPAMGPLRVDHLTYGDALDATDYGLPALTSNIATLTTNTTIEWKDADVTDEFKNDIANARSTSQYRLHFTTEASGGTETGDFLHFDSANSYAGNSGRSPQLVVKYY